jgi:serine/threonine protein kinase
MNHPNVIKVINHFNHEDNSLIVFELLTGGDLFTKIKHKELKYNQIAPIFRGICTGIQYIHSRKIIHRNLKSETILLDTHMNPKIVDFGLAAKLSSRRTFCGCYYYMAPEILKNQEYNEKADIWALGIILYEMVYGDVPFKG